MKNTIIYSAGLTTRSIIEIFKKNNSNLSLIGIVDDNINLIGQIKYGQKIISTRDSIDLNINEYNIKNFIIGIGSYKHHVVRNERFIWFKNLGLQPINCISESSYQSLDAKIGDGNLIFPFAMIGSGVEVGDNNIIDVSTSILEETVIPNNVHICSNSFIGAGCNFGDNVYIGPGVTIASGLSIGENSVIGAGSVVMKDVPSNVIGYGNPFKLIDTTKK